MTHQAYKIILNLTYRALKHYSCKVRHKRKPSDNYEPFAVVVVTHITDSQHNLYNPMCMVTHLMLSVMIYVPTY